MVEITVTKPGLCCGITVEPVLFLSMFVTYCKLGLSQNLIYSNVCIQQFNDSICSNLKEYKDIEGYVQTESSYWIMVSNIVLVIPSMIVAMYLGSWSDKIGRKLPLILSPIGDFIGISIFTVMSANSSIPVWVVIPANFVMGLFGGSTALVATGYTYISAVSKESQRTIRISRATAFQSLGSASGPFIVASLIGYVGRTYVFVMMLALLVVNASYILIFIPNIKPEITTDQLPESCCNKYFSLKHVSDSFVTIFKKREKNKRRTIVLLMVATFVTLLYMIGEINITYLYAVDDPLNWSYSTYSYYQAFNKAGCAIGLLILLPIAKKYGCSDLTICIASVVSKMSSLILLGVSYTTIMMFAAQVLNIFSPLSVTSTRSQLSVIVEKSEQGKIMSFIGIMTNITSIVAALTYNSIYPLTRSFYHGLLFEASAAISIIPLIIFCWLLINNHKIPAERELEEQKPSLPKDLEENNN